MAIGVPTVKRIGKIINSETFLNQSTLNIFVPSLCCKI